MPECMVIQDDTCPTVHHIIRGSEDGLAHVRRGVEARINAKALQAALNVASRELMARMDRVTSLEQALHQEHRLTEELEARLEHHEHLMRTVAG